jgi:hypothetical protein
MIWVVASEVAVLVDTEPLVTAPVVEALILAHGSKIEVYLDARDEFLFC